MQTSQHLRLLFFFVSLFLCQVTFAANKKLLDISRSHPFYLGGLVGYGTTTWGYLADPTKKTEISTPVSAQEGGFAGGLLIGYEISPYFAFEGLYVHFPEADVDFSEWSLYNSENNLLGIRTKSDVFSLSGKFFAPIANTQLRGYGLVGIGLAHRSDELAKTHNIFVPVFGTGLNYTYNEHIMTELGFTYYAGHAKSDLRPVDDFMPFLYTFHVTFIYRI